MIVNKRDTALSSCIALPLMVIFILYSFALLIVHRLFSNDKEERSCCLPTGPTVCSRYYIYFRYIHLYEKKCKGNANREQTCQA